MKNFKKILYIIASNYIHIIGFYATAYLSQILFKLIGIQGTASSNWSEVIVYSLFTILLAFLTYGIIIIIGFYLVLSILDIIGFGILKAHTKKILLTEWIIISSPLVYWAFEYNYWIWIAFSISFLITQLIREKWIYQIHEEAA